MNTSAGIVDAWMQHMTGAFLPASHVRLSQAAAMIDAWGYRAMFGLIALALLALAGAVTRSARPDPGERPNLINRRNGA